MKKKSTPSKMKRSKIWLFFTPKNDNQARCNICKKTVSYKTSTSNLKIHLKRKHESYYDKFNKETDFDQLVQCTKRMASSTTERESTRTNDLASVIVENNEEMDIGNSMQMEEFSSSLTDELQIENDDICVADEEILKALNEQFDDPNLSESAYYETSDACHHCSRKSEKAFKIMLDIKEQMNKRDEYSVFGEYVANQIRKLQTHTRQQTARQCITNVLYNLQMAEANEEKLDLEALMNTDSSLIAYLNETTVQRKLKVPIPRPPTFGGKNITIPKIAHTGISKTNNVTPSTNGIITRSATRQTPLKTSGSSNFTNNIGSTYSSTIANIDVQSAVVMDPCQSSNVMRLSSSELLDPNDQLLVESDIVFLQSASEINSELHIGISPKISKAQQPVFITNPNDSSQSLSIATGFDSITPHSSPDIMGIDSLVGAQFDSSTDEITASIIIDPCNDDFDVNNDLGKTFTANDLCI